MESSKLFLALIFVLLEELSGLVFCEITESKNQNITESNEEEVRTARLSEFPRETPPNDPRFVTYNNTVVEAQVGAIAILHCKTSSTTGGLVSWIRKRDYQILTVGLQSHSSDERFSINYVHWDWQLHVRYVQPRDGGAYECQVSSDPPASIFVHLDVVEAEAEILGSPEKHVKAGSILRLVCILHHTTEAPAYVFWYRGGEMINYNEEQSIVVESDEHTSVLLVTKASRRHSGNYTCVPSNAKAASILVHVLTGRNGEYPAAMQHGESSTVNSKSLSLSFVCLMISLLFSFVSLPLAPSLTLTPTILSRRPSPSSPSPRKNRPPTTLKSSSFGLSKEEPEDIHTLLRNTTKEMNSLSLILKSSKGEYSHQSTQDFVLLIFFQKICLWTKIRKRFKGDICKKEIASSLNIR